MKDFFSSPTKRHFDDSPTKSPKKPFRFINQLNQIASPSSPNSPNIIGTSPIILSKRGSFGQVDLFATPKGKVAVKTVYLLKDAKYKKTLPVGIEETRFDDIKSEIESLSMRMEGCVDFIGAEFDMPDEDDKIVEVRMMMEGGTPLEEVLGKAKECEKIEYAQNWLSTIKKINLNGKLVSDPKVSNVLLIKGQVRLCDIDFREKPIISNEYKTYGDKNLKYKKALWIGFQEIANYGNWTNRDTFMKNLRERAETLTENDLTNFYKYLLSPLK